jgi:hypothetical protein
MKIMPDKQTALSRIVGVEEHIAFPDLMSRLPEAAVVEKGYLSRDRPFGKASMLDKLGDTDDRIRDLDAVGLTVQVLSYPFAGADVLPPHEAPGWAKAANDALARRIAVHPDRYVGLAHLPLTNPEAAADAGCALRRTAG